ncbi:YncE family protein [Ornithinimicrobium faecis]|uniref:YncE family protein n=1 Tax=Ornithinimicrobium faecis TaxID=2934158 RepID=UPI002117AF6D|nr:PQQ-like beta-propeller repeat protein [Ornithinimicrobium sp. HY1745]
MVWRLGAGITAVTAVVLTTALLASALTPVSDDPEQSWRVNGRVNAVLVVGDTVYVGGTFTRATSPSGEVVTRANLAAFDVGTGELRRDFRADAGSSVRALETDGEDLYVGGWFGRIQGVTRSRLAKIDLATGLVDGTFRPAASGAVLALDYKADALYVGGDFQTIAGASRNRLAKVDAVSGVLDATFRASAGGQVRALVTSPVSNTLYVAGRFGTLSSVSRTGLGAVSTTTGSVVGPVFASSVNPTLDLSINSQGTALYGAIDAGNNNVSAWNVGSGARLWRQTAMGDVQAVDYYDGRVYFGFHEGFGGNTTLKLLAADAQTGAIANDFAPTFTGFWGVFDIDAHAGGVVAGGEFTNVGGVPAQGFVRFEAGGEPPPEDVVLIDGATADWRYWDRGAAPNDWRQLTFDDAAWEVGNAEFGYGDGDEQTIVDYGLSPTDKYMTTYFRTTLTVEEAPDQLAIELKADDGAVVFLNGSEIVRDNMPTGSIGFSTRAAANRSGSAEAATRSFTLDPGRLTQGVNVLAIEVHQDYRASSDLSMDADLLATG